MKECGENSESKEGLSKLIENSGQPFALGLPDGKLISVNKSFCKLTGYSKELLTTKMRWDKDLTPKKWWDREYETLKDSIKSKKFATYRKEYKRKNGEIIPVELFVQPEYDARGEFKFFYAFITNISEHVKREDKLRKEKETAKQYLNIASVMIVILDSRGRVKVVNKKGCEVLGYTEEEIIGKDWFANFLPKEVRLKTRTVFDSLLKGDLTKTYEFENEVLTKEGKKKLISWKNNFISEEGEIVSSISSGEDITEKRKAEKALKESQELLTQSQEIGKIGAWKLKVESEEIEFTDETYSIFEIEKGTKMNLEKFFSIVHPEDKKHLMDEWERSRSKGNFNVEHRVLLGDKIKWIREKADITYDDKGQAIKAIGISQDITKKKTIEEKLEESRGKYQVLFENMTNGFALHEIFLDKKGKPTDYRFLEMNAAFEKMMKLNRKDVVGKKISEVLKDPAKLNQSLIETYGEVAVRGKPSSIERYSKSLKKWFSIIVFSPGKNKFATIVEDITLRKEYEKDMELSSKEWETTFNAIPDLISIHDKNFRVIRANKAFADFCKMSQEEVVGKKCFNIVHNTKSPWKGCPLKEILEGGDPVTKEFFDDERKIYLEVTVVPLTDEADSPDGFVHVIRNVTGKKVAEKETLKKNEELEKFSHFAIGRELKMIELKREVDSLLVKLGNSKKYDA